MITRATYFLTYKVEILTFSTYQFSVFVNKMMNTKHILEFKPIG